MLIQIAWVASCVLITAIILLSIYLKIMRYHLRKKEKENTQFKNEYEASLIEYLYSGDALGEMNATQESIIQKIKVSVPIKAKRKIIISVLYNLMNEVSGEMSDSIKLLYYKTGLIRYALERLESKRWHIIAKGIGELTRFKIDEVHHKVSKFVNHPRSEVRKETQLYLVSLFRFEGLSFLNNLTTPLSEWAQIQLLETLQKFDDQQICDIRPWLKSTNDSVVLFALKLAQIYNQFEVQDTLMELLSHPKKQIRITAIQVLTHLYGVEAKELLKANFNDLSLEEQICFFGMLEKLVMPTDEPFVEKYLFHKNFEIQLLALKILKSINIDKYMGLSQTATNEKDSSMIKLVNSL
ncbi:HEAT repeat domain-containing protein [Snuella sedimenti]|uniref:HEAT repeat domain-containing protein n=1 Tax=Snuella sedimenti TaxID=2798802 RepID=A0A8J7J0Y9_9FLAO|nr:HEAT repeat domain-containing protein [Snuella sedimenti]MBJ6367582.1 HEAT repeat domain-containing protein [Snuella sedimenti]